MSLEQLLEVYGYPVLFLGTFIEGETPLLMAGFLAHRGYLALPFVIAVAFAGTFASDQVFFYLGRTRGRRYLERHPAWASKAKRANALLQRFGLPLVVGFRFIYGVRTVTPFVVGMSGFDPSRFLLLNIFGGILWSIVFGLVGYGLGGLLELGFEDLKSYELLVLGAFAAVSVVAWLVHRRSRRRSPGESGDLDAG